MSKEPDWEQAKAALSKAITEYYGATTGEYVDGWVLCTSKLSVEMEQDGTSAVGVLVKTGQSFALSRGILEIAAESSSFSGREE